MKHRSCFFKIKLYCAANVFLLITASVFLIHLLAKEKTTWGILLTLCIIGLNGFNLFLFAAFVLGSEKYYKNLCDRFTDGMIYREFVDKAGGLFPPLHGAIQRLDSLLDRQNVIQLSTKQAEYLALQNQINPHFLYNTLEAIRGDALCAGMENIADITEALSTFFRYTITETKNLVTIRDELDNVDSYFKIQQYRFGEKLSMDIQMCDDRDTILRLQCPKLTLQPIIENAIFHGLEKRNAKGLISVMLEIVDDNLHINISDNGAGIEEEKLAKLNNRLNRASVGYIVEDEESRRGGIALKNVSRRIKLLFGEEYGIHINSIIGIGTKVVLTLPIIRANSIT